MQSIVEMERVFASASEFANNPRKFYIRIGIRIRTLSAINMRIRIRIRTMQRRMRGLLIIKLF